MQLQKEKKSYKDKKLGYFQTEKEVTTLYITGLVYSKTEKDIKELLEKYGKVAYVKVVMDLELERSKGIAFVQMINAKHAQKAIDELNGTQIDGRIFKISIADNRRAPRIQKANKSIKTQTVETSKKEAPVAKKPIRRPYKKTGLDKLKTYLGAK